MPNPFQEQLDDAFPIDSDANVIRGVSEGVLLGDSIVKHELFLNNPLGRDLRGHLRRAGILFRLHTMAEAGDVPFQSKMMQMPRGNWHWIEMQNNKITAHVCRTDGPDQFPDDTPTRQDDRLSNQLNLFKIVKSEEEIQNRVAWLMFGVGDSGAMGHLCWGMPNSKGDDWLARTNILRRIESNQIALRPAESGKSIKMRFRRHIEEVMEKDADQAEAKKD